VKILIDFNGWQKAEDVSPELVRSGKIQFCIMPPLRVDCGPQRVPENDPEINLIVYATGANDKNGLPIFSNRA
jgi:hypothetical protein